MKGRFGESYSGKVKFNPLFRRISGRPRQSIAAFVGPGACWHIPRRVLRQGTPRCKQKLTKKGKQKFKNVQRITLGYSDLLMSHRGALRKT